MNDTDKLREQVSALLDGQLRGDEFARAVERVCAREELRGTWHAYHVVGDVLRSGEHAACQDPEAFLERFRARLAVEHIRPPAVASDPATLEAVNPALAAAANEPVFRWKLVAGLASVAAAAAIGWNWGGSLLQGSAGAQLAQQSSGAAPVLASSVQPPAAPPAATTTTRVLVGNNPTPQVMLRDPRLDALLEAHQQAGGASHMPSGFLRNATFEGQSR